MPFELILLLFLLAIAEPLLYMRKKYQLGVAVTEVNVPTQERVLRFVAIVGLVYLFIFRDTVRYRAIFANFSNIPGTMQFRFVLLGAFLLMALGFTAYGLFKKPEIYELGFTVAFKAIRWKEVESYRLNDCTLEVKLKRIFSKDYKLLIPNEMRERISGILQEHLHGKERQ